MTDVICPNGHDATIYDATNVEIIECPRCGVQYGDQSFSDSRRLALRRANEMRAIADVRATMSGPVEPEHNVQVCPYPTALKSLVDRVHYKDWGVQLNTMDRGQGSAGLTLVITSSTPNSYGSGAINVRHFFIVPAAAYDERAWMRWLFDQCLLVEAHEAMEFFKIDGKRMYAPNHGPGRNPYSILERGTEEDANADQRGNPAPDLA